MISTSVAIPYKSGKYSYQGDFMLSIGATILVAIPYKSGKYSYPGTKKNFTRGLKPRRNPL